MSRSLFILSCLHFGSYYYSSPSGFSRTTVFIKENGISYIIVKLLGFFFPLHWPPYMTLFIWYWTGSSPTPSPSCSLQLGYTGAALIWFVGRGWFEWLWWSACRAACCWHGCFVYLCLHLTSRSKSLVCVDWGCYGQWRIHAALVMVGLGVGSCGVSWQLMWKLLALVVGHSGVFCQPALNWMLLVANTATEWMCYLHHAVVTVALLSLHSVLVWSVWMLPCGKFP